MSDSIKTTYRTEFRTEFSGIGRYRTEYRTEFPRIGRVLTVELWSDDVATIKISSDNAKLLLLKKFTDYNEAMNYYSEQLNNLESAEEYETMRYAFKMLDSMEG